VSKKKSSIPLFKYKPELKKALVVVAHPDDIDFGCAGTVATLTAHGVEVVYCLVTSGDAGGDASTHTKEERAAIRESEQTAAAREVGVTTLEFLRYADGTVEPTLALRKDISRVIRKHQPDLVISQNPERNWERIYGSHPDHMAAGEATVRAVYPDARNPHSYPELLEEGYQPHTVPELWITGLAPTMAVDITKQFDRKIAALRQHESQVGHREDLREMMLEWARNTAKSFGFKKGTLVEAFKVVNTK
jgi:LmbE family N-acetylglucosaminyl deacetylase